MRSVIPELLIFTRLISAASVLHGNIVYINYTPGNKAPSHSKLYRFQFYWPLKVCKRFFFWSRRDWCYCITYYHNRKLGYAFSHLVWSCHQAFTLVSYISDAVEWLRSNSANLTKSLSDLVDRLFLQPVKSQYKLQADAEAGSCNCAPKARCQ